MTKNYLQTSFNRNLSQNLIIQKADAFIAFKRELDQNIKDKIEEYGDKKALQRADIKMQLVDEIYDTLSPQVKDGIGEILTIEPNEEFKPDDVNPNLILSEIFIPGESKRDLPQGEAAEHFISEKSVLKVSKIRTNFW